MRDRLDGQLIVDLSNAAVAAVLDSIELKSKLAPDRVSAYLITMFTMAAIAARYQSFISVMPNSDEIEAIKIYYKECLLAEIDRTVKFRNQEGR